ncbi:putative membrane protein YeaQ/YmgE (transglycosylase-associated protein family) [Arthrobacter silviterrae]|uniref:GlsB/YeaQ/YmgE family stress response membrane protein n=1 Tax=Arthrobacter silviterrae TaxID=2026658 RepID=A0ABX0D9I2_9MICC|nr:MULTISPECIES: GlsB/YeaQ/YmgE family stress response membrane protein [Arthrobacter]MCU6479863.1 GlsB/YeaQ/YmgE family stress response membrane protein [Arthrobacter sp. A2-55]MDQ0278654.1 putative membrane protein YeaQ/YmgE (transglycosylase-associated protein family) [Arthrobacter silviterrae]NGN83348.1 GlsB/YeaQ/YmgE family stress response membrane protein [Arthrobacter silviterrae]
MGFFGFIILGLIVGAIVKAIMPGKVQGGWVTSIILGVVGAIVGGLLGSLIFHTDLGSFFNIKTWLLSIGGGLVVAAVYGAIKGRK